MRISSGPVHFPRLAQALLLTLLALLLAGCSALPGFRDVSASYVQSDEEAGYRWDSEENRWVQSNKVGNATAPQLIPITPDLLIEQKKDRLQEQDSPQALRLQEDVDYQYTIGPHDVLSIIVWGHPDLSNPLGELQDIKQTGRRVSAEGTIFYPYAGTMDVSGLTTREVRQKLMQRLNPYLEDPQVSVRVVSFQSKKCYVTGAVRKPGIQPVTDVPLSVMDAINQAGGLIPQGGEDTPGSGQQAILTRGDKRHLIDIQRLYTTGKQDFLLRDGDVLHIPDNSENKVFVLGEVNRQTSVLMKQGELTLAEAISQAEWFNLETANTGGIYVIRGVPRERVSEDGDRMTEARGQRTEDKPRSTEIGVRTLEEHEQAGLEIVPRVYQLDASAVTSLILADKFQLQPRDVVYVSPSGLVSWNRFLNKILPTVTTYYRLDRLVR